MARRSPLAGSLGFKVLVAVLLAAASISLGYAMRLPRAVPVSPGPPGQ